MIWIVLHFPFQGILWFSKEPKQRFGEHNRQAFICLFVNRCAFLKMLQYFHEWIFLYAQGEAPILEEKLRTQVQLTWEFEKKSFVTTATQDEIWLHRIYSCQYFKTWLSPTNWAVIVFSTLLISRLGQVL